MASVALVRWPPDVDEPVVLDYGGVPFHATVTTVIGDFSMNVAIAGFCMSGIADKLGKNKQVVTERGREYSEGKDFKVTLPRQDSLPPAPALPSGSRTHRSPRNPAHPARPAPRPPRRRTTARSRRTSTRR